MIYRHRPFPTEGQKNYGAFNINVALYDEGGWQQTVLIDASSGAFATTATMGASVRDGKICLYFSLENLKRSPKQAQLIMAEYTETGWEFMKLGPPQLSAIRCSVIKIDNGDLLYVTAPESGDLFLYEVPARLSGVEHYGSAEELLNAL